MKKFLIVAIICIVTASLGLLTFNFMATKEKIIIDDVVYYVNVGEDFTISYDRVDPKTSTKINITYDGFEDYVGPTSTENNYIAKTAGKAVMKLESNISGFTPVTINVYIGDGSEFAPHYIDNANELSKVGRGEDGYFKSTSSYLLTADIDLENVSFDPLCNTADGFTGKFNFAGHTISNLLINSASSDNAGLFAKVGKNGEIIRGNLKNVTIKGSYSNAGAYAGINNGIISNSNVTCVDIVDSKAGANVGGLVGYSTNKITSSFVRGADNMTTISGATSSNVGGLVGNIETTDASKITEITRVYSLNVNVKGDNVGGLVGYMKGAEVRNAYSRNCEVISDSQTANIGGLVGKMDYQPAVSNIGSTVLNVYSTNHIASTLESADALVGNLNEYNRTEKTINTANIVIGAYYFSTTNTKLTNSNFVLVKKLDNVANITVDTFVTKTNLKDKDHNTDDMRDAKFDENIWDIKAGAYPELIMDNVDGTSTIQRTGNVAFVEGIDDITNKQGNKIILDKDIDGANSTKTKNATGSIFGELTREFDGAGYTIKNFTFTGPMFSKITSRIYNLTLENITVETDEFNIGILTAINEGSISNIKFVNCHIIVDMNNNETETNVGMVAGVNNSYINEIVVKSTETSANSIKLIEKRAGNVNVGLMVGKNTWSLKNSVVTSGVNAYIGENIEKAIYVGGVAGDNINGSIEYVAVGYGVNIQKENATDISNATVSANREATNIVIGGVAGYNQGSIRYCEISGVYYGYMFGGIAGENNGQADDVVEENTVTANTWAQASKLGGLVGAENMGTIKNCSTYATLDGYNAEANVGGITTVLRNYASVHNCFISTTFTGEGIKYFEVANTDHVHDMDDDIENVIINTKNMDGARSNNYNETGNWVANIGGWAANLFQHFTTDIRVSDEDCKNLTTYTNNNFSQDIWILGNEYPRLQKISAETNSLASIIAGLKI